MDPVYHKRWQRGWPISQRVEWFLPKVLALCQRLAAKRSESKGKLEMPESSYSRAYVGTKLWESQYWTKLNM